MDHSEAHAQLGVRLKQLQRHAPETLMPAGPGCPRASCRRRKTAPNWTKQPAARCCVRLVGNGGRPSRWRGPVHAVFDCGPSIFRRTIRQPARHESGRHERELRSRLRLPNSAVNGECGVWSDLTFGQIRAGSTRRAEDALGGVNGQDLQTGRGRCPCSNSCAPRPRAERGLLPHLDGGFLATDNRR